MTSLTKLYLDHNRIFDVTPLAGLTALTALDLSHNAIATFSGAFAFDRLEVLELSNNGLKLIADSALAGSTLSQVALAGNELTELDAFEHVKFVPSWVGSSYPRMIQARLDLSGNRVQSLSSLLRWSPQKIAIVAVGNPIDCALEGDTLAALRAREDTVDVCP